MGRLVTLLLASIGLLSGRSGNAFDHRTPYQTGFLENRGQISDQFGNPRNDVKYIFPGNGFKMVLKENSWSYEFYKVRHVTNTSSPVNEAHNDEFNRSESANTESHRIDVTLLNANQHPVILAEDIAEDVRHYYNGSAGWKGMTGIRHFKKIIYQDIYPQIDLQVQLITDQSGKFAPKYSFIVNPGGDMSDIQMVYEGQTSLSLRENRIEVNTSIGLLKDGSPVYFVGDENVSVSGKFLVNGNIVSFSPVKKDPSQKLIIDPQIEYGTYFGSDSADLSEDLLLDHEKNMIVCGRTASTSGFTTTGAWQSIYGGGNFDSYILKFNASFQLQWVTYFGGHQVDYGWSMDVDHLNNIYLGGESYSDGLATPDAQQKKVDGLESDGLVAKFTPSGTLIWSRYFGGANKDQVLGIKVDPFNRVLIAGYTLSNDSISTPGSFQPGYGGKGDGFLCAMDSDGKTIWSTYYGVNKDDRSHHVTTDKHGNIIMTGTALSQGLGTAGAFHTNHAGYLDAILVKFTPSGTRLWSTYLGGAYDDRSRECEVDHDGNILLCGYTQSDTGVASAGSFKSYFSTGFDSTGVVTHDAFLAKFDSNGNRLWATYFGDTLTETARGLAINSNNDIFISGTTFSADHIAYGNAYQMQLGGISDLYFTKFNTQGDVVWSSYYGGSDEEVVGGYGQVIRVDKENAIYITGSTLSSDSIATPGAYKTSFSSNAYDLYIAKFEDKCFDRYEPNNSFSAAKMIGATEDTTTAGYYASIALSSDKDFYQFTLTAGKSKLKVRLFELPANYNLFLYDSAKQLIASSQKTGKKSELIKMLNPGDGKYYVKVIPKNAAFDDSSCYRFTVIEYGDMAPRELSLMEMKDDDHLSLNPNPAADHFVLTIDAETAGAALIEISDVIGRIILKRSFSLQEGYNEFNIDSRMFPKGMYLVIMNDGHMRMTGRIVIE